MPGNTHTHTYWPIMKINNKPFVTVISIQNDKRDVGMAFFVVVFVCFSTNEFHSDWPFSLTWWAGWLAGWLCVAIRAG